MTTQSVWSYGKDAIVSTGLVIEIGRDLLLTAIVLSLPAVGVSLLIGFLVSLFQTVTSIQEQTLTFAPRIVAVGLVLVATLPWTIQLATSFTMRMMTRLLEVSR